MATNFDAKLPSPIPMGEGLGVRALVGEGSFHLSKTPSQTEEPQRLYFSPSTEIWLMASKFGV
jgi:hypothetical protein